MTAPPPEWAAERLVDEAAAAALVAAQFPSLAGAPVRLLAEGWDNTVIVVGGVWAFRFPRREIALAGVRREIAVLPGLAPLLPLPVPVPELVGVPSAEFPWPFFGAPLLAGVELCDAGLTEDARVALARGLGAFLAALHAPTVAAGHGAGLPVDPLGRAVPSARVPLARRFLGRLRDRGTWAGDPRVDALLESALAVGSAGDARSGGPAPVLVHGDLHARHVLVSPDGSAAGVIDWGDLCLADPCVDLSVAYSAFSGPARRALFTAYRGSLDAQGETRARMLAVMLCAALADYAAAEDRPALLAESLAGLRRAVS